MFVVLSAWSYVCKQQLTGSKQGATHKPIVQAFSWGDYLLPLAEGSAAYIGAICIAWAVISVGVGAASLGLMSEAFELSYSIYLRRKKMLDFEGCSKEDKAPRRLGATIVALTFCRSASLSLRTL